MDTLVRLVLLAIGVTGAVRSETSRDLRREYGPTPLVFAAVPLHAPVPVLHVLTPARRRPSPSASASDLELQETAPTSRYHRLRPRPTAPAYRDTDYEESYEYTRLHEARPYAATDDYQSYGSHPAPTRAISTTHSHLYSGYGGESETVYAGSAELYARPSPSGGYTYRRAVKVTPPPPPPPPLLKPTKEPPYIIKIHKYRIVKDRRRR